VTFIIRTANRERTHRELGPAIASARNATKHGATVTITCDRLQWWTLTNHQASNQAEVSGWQVNHCLTIASLFDQPPNTPPIWLARALELLARLDESASATNPNPLTTMEVNAS
jgi:hypothetical protein